MAEHYLRFIMEDAPFHLTDVLLGVVNVVMLERWQHLVIRVAAEGLCKGMIRSLEYVLLPFVTHSDSSAEKTSAALRKQLLI